MSIERVLFTCCVIVLIAVSAPAAEPGASGSLVFTGDRHTTFADTYQYSTLNRQFKIENRADKPITIIEGIAVSGTGQVTYDPAPIAPGATTKINVTQPIGDKLGTTAFRFAIVTDESGHPKHRFSLTGFVQSAYDPEAVMVNLGFIDSRQSASAEFELHCREVEALRLTSAETGHSLITTEATPTGFAEEGLVIRLTAAHGLPRGILHGIATLTTNVESQPRFDFRYTANVFDDVVPSENPVAFGLVRSGQEAITKTLLKSRSETPFEIDRATNTIGEILGVSHKPCDGSPRGPSPCHQLQFSLSPEEEKITEGTVHLFIVGDPEPVPIKITSWVVSPNTIVKKIGTGVTQ